MVEMLLRFRQKIRNIPVKQSPALAVETDQMEIFLALKRATDEALEELADFDGLLAEMEERTPDGGTGESGINERIFARLKPPPETAPVRLGGSVSPDTAGGGRAGALANG